MTKTAKDLLASTKRYQQIGMYAAMYEHGRNYTGETDCSHYVKRYSYRGDIVAMADMKYRVLMTSNYGRRDTPFMKSFIEHYVDGLGFQLIKYDYEGFMTYEMPRKMYRYTEAIEINADIEKGEYRGSYKTFEYNSHTICIVDMENEVFITNHCGYVNHDYVDKRIEGLIEYYKDKGYMHINGDDLEIPEFYMGYAMWNYDSLDSIDW